ncbi:hypothetical protein LX32DRAFT_636652, partial [Colletotrichum zoysiae]
MCPAKSHLFAVLVALSAIHPPLSLNHASQVGKTSSSSLVTFGGRLLSTILEQGGRRVMEAFRILLCATRVTFI